MDTTLTIIGIIGAITANILVVVHSTLKLRSQLKETAQEINTHTDVSVTKLNGMLRNVISSFDRPCWVKLAVKENDNTVFRMLEMNQHYEKVFGITREKYIGKTDLEAGWEHETAAKFHDHDLMVWASGNPTTCTEFVNGKELMFRKMRVTSYTGEARGILAYSIDTNEEIAATPKA